MTPPRLRARILVGPALRAQPDRRLVALAREGHEPALEEIVRRYRPALVRYAATIVPADRADDVFQDAFSRAVPKIRGGEQELHLRAWLYTIVRNTALNNLRDNGPAHDHLDENLDGVEQPTQALERREELAAMVAGVQALPETQREALVKREMEGMSHSEIGASMGVSVAAARQLIHRGRITLRESLGALIPMPVMRQLLEGMGAPAAAGTGAGGALAAKGLIALLAAGGALTAGVALHRHSHDPARADLVVAEGGRGGSNSDPLGATTGGAGKSGGNGASASGDEAAGRDGKPANEGSGSTLTSLKGGSGTGADPGSAEPGDDGGHHSGSAPGHAGEGSDDGAHHGGDASGGHSGTGGGDDSGEHSGESAGHSGGGDGPSGGDDGAGTGGGNTGGGGEDHATGGGEPTGGGSGGGSEGASGSDDGPSSGKSEAPRPGDD